MFNLKVIFFVSCLIVAATAQRVGGVTTLQGADREEAVKLLTKSLSQLSSGDVQTYTIVEVGKVTGQVVAGNLYTYEVTVRKSDNAVKTCSISIWSRVWLEDGNELTIKCPNEKDVHVKQHP